MTANIVAGITLVLVPLLALSANLVARVKQIGQKNAHIITYHMDKICKTQHQNQVLRQMDDIESQSSTTMILISSPQALADNKKFRDQLLKCHRRRTLRANVIDKAHIWAMHGKSFCYSQFE